MDSAWIMHEIKTVKISTKLRVKKDWKNNAIKRHTQHKFLIHTRCKIEYGKVKILNTTTLRQKCHAIAYHRFHNLF